MLNKIVGMGLFICFCSVILGVWPFYNIEMPSHDRPCIHVEKDIKVDTIIHNNSKMEFRWFNKDSTQQWATSLTICEDKL